MLQAKVANTKVVSASEIVGALPAEIKVAQSAEAVIVSGAHADDPALRNLPAFCRVVAVLSPVPRSHIVMELWLPQQWNGKLLAIGNHGLGGEIEYADLALGLHRGYAVANTDTGHTAPKDAVTGAHSFINNVVVTDDYAWRAIHEMAVAAKGLVLRNYKTAATKAYFDGCSTGGRMAVREAQQFPADYDGIIAGSGALYWTRSFAEDLYQFRAGTLPTGGQMSMAKLKVAQAAAIAACDKTDGLVDGVIANPTACHWDPHAIQCQAGADESRCLTAAEVAVVEKIEGPIKDPKTGEFVFYGLTPGGEELWRNMTGMNLTVANFFRDLVVADPKWTPKDADLVEMIRMSEKPGAPGSKFNSFNPNLSAFRARGGKMIQYHGWNDQSFAPGAIAHFYSTVIDAQPAANKTAQAQSFYRLFMVPGMGHCSGGYGPINFGGLATPAPPVIDADHDILEALDRWVGKGVAPDRIIATTKDDAKGPRRQMPLCPYPSVATYVSGDVNRAESFQCKAPVRTAAR
jgi:hypothetical protein